ncbi:hypothetical protein LLG95_05890 [bacterium]|nr:hypothetical protein [bacterium]
MKPATLITLLLMTFLAGCASVEVGTGTQRHRSSNWCDINLALTFPAFDNYDGHIFRASLLDCDEGELASVDVWPIASCGIGFVGARAKLFPVEVGFGFLGYDPKPTLPEPKCKPKPDCKETPKPAPKPCD